MALFSFWFKRLLLALKEIEFYDPKYPVVEIADSEFYLVLLLGREFLVTRVFEIETSSSFLRIQMFFKSTTF